MKDSPVPGEPIEAETSPIGNGLKDLELVRRTLAGETRAFDELMNRYRDRVFRLAYHMLWNKHEADDVAQEVFVRAYGHLGKFRGDSGFFTWLYRIAVNVVYTHSKKAGRRREIHRSARETLEHRATPPLSPERSAQHAEIMEQIHLGLQHLDCRLREVLILREIEGLDTAEVAQILHIPAGTVKSRLFRAQEDLREWLLAHGIGRQEGES